MQTNSLRNPTTILICGGLVLMIALGMRHGFGLFLQPMTLERGWGREVFAFAIALQNLLWGVAQPFAGMIADKYGAGRVLVGGALLYACGLIVMALAPSVFGFGVGAGVLIGIGLSGTTFSIVMGVIGRVYPPEKRSMALGIAGAMGSFGMFFMMPLEQTLISNLGWVAALLTLAAIVALVAPISAPLAGKPQTTGKQTQTARQAMSEALRHKSFLLLFAGFFVCGFQVVFIAVHLPAYLLDRGMSPQIGMTALALIGFFNIIGSYSAGWLGGKYRKKYLLSSLYFGRSVAITLFLLVPLSPMSVYLFAAAIGLLWLSTVPLTNGLVAHIFGVQYLSMLAGFVFFGHQIGSFLGVWLGGFLYDATGSYDVVWMITIGLGIAAGIANLPVEEQRPAQAAAT